MIFQTPDPFIKPEPAEEKKSKDTFQSDMKLTPEQEDQLGIHDEGLDLSKKKAISWAQYRWPGARVPFKISSASSK